MKYINNNMITNEGSDVNISKNNLISNNKIN